MEFRLNWRPTIVLAIWLAWLVVSVMLTWSPFLWHINYFAKPGPEFQRLLLVSLPLLATVSLIHLVLRQRGLWKYEPALLVGFLLVVAALHQPRPTFVVAWLVIACFAVGRYGRQKLGLDIRSPVDDIAISTGIGLGAMICVLFVLGLLGGYYWWAFLVLLAAPCVLLRREVPWLVVHGRALYANWRSREEFRRPIVGFLMFFAAVFGMLTLLVALAPTIAVDAMRDHLPAIRHYATTHGLAPVPFLPSSLFPQSVEVLMSLTYSLGGQAASQMVSPAFFALTLLLAFAVARRCDIDRLGSLTGVVVAGTIPFLHWTGSILKNDVALAFFQLASLYCYLRAKNSMDRNWLRLGVFFLAMSFGVKHVALFGGLPLGLLYLHAMWKSPRRRRLAASLVLVFAIFGPFWHLRAFWLTGNPVYPMRWETALSRKIEPPESNHQVKRMSYFRIPWAIHFEGRTASALRSPSDNPMGIFLVLFAPAWLLVRRRFRQPGERACLLFTAAYCLYWGSAWPTLRYAIVPILLCFLFTAARFAALYERSRGLLRVLIQAGLFYGFVFALLVAMLLEVNAPQLQFFLGRLDAKGYLREVVAEYASLEYLKQHAQPDDWILALNHRARGYAPDVARFHSVFVHGSEPARRIVTDAFDQRRYRFLIVPHQHLASRLVEHLKPRYVLDPVFEDARSLVYDSAVRGKSRHRTVSLDRSMSYGLFCPGTI